MSGPELQTDVPHSARIWNYWLGGTDNFPVDRAAGEQYRAAFPGVVAIARASRQFLARSVRFLAADAGIDQFLDIGAGLPSLGNTHQVAPDARVLYLDHDPQVVAHAEVLLAAQGAADVTYVHGELEQTMGILDAAATVLEMDRPVGLILSGVLGHVPETAEAQAIVASLLAALAPGSYLSLNDGTQVFGGEQVEQAQQDYNDTGAIPYSLRTPAQIAEFFDGLELVEPGVVSCPRWRPEPGADLSEVDAYGGVGRKSE
jgi:O-methyltransferase involved in polyketide biosynthesis